MYRYLLIFALFSTSTLSSPQEQCSEIYRSGGWDKAKQVCETAAKLGNPRDMYYLANVYGRKNTLPENELKRIAWYSKAAEAGDYESQRALAFHYSFEKKNRLKAEYYLLMSAIHQEADEIAFNSTGRFYRISNQDVEKNEVLLQERWAESYKWHMKAAEMGDAYGQIKVGDLYKDGMGVEQDWHEALNWYKKAATQGDIYAYYRLGYLYLHGVKDKEQIIVQKDVARAYGYLKYAAEKWGKFGHVDLGRFDAFISNPFKKLPWKLTYGKRYHNPKDDLKKLNRRLGERELKIGEDIYESVVSNEFNL